MFGCNALNMTQVVLELIAMLTYIYSLKKVRKVQLFIFLKERVKLTIVI